jgi:hypothetical protein
MLNRAKTAEERLLEKELQRKTLRLLEKELQRKTLSSKRSCVYCSAGIAACCTILSVQLTAPPIPALRRETAKKNPTDNKHVAKLVFARVQLFTTIARS